ncbi:MAG TPA: efflux RND transporter periplasmic adaptor subunit [Cyclobacteriaceae bacterium]|nr:efflux RND transporter periplasmic adaptor subunit [Cyclobacteriaceae bacterium]
MRVAINVLSILALYACQNNSSRIKPVIEDISESVYASGVVKSQDQYEVFSTVNGIINVIYVEEGDTVNAGAPILKMLNTPSELSARNAQLAAEYAKLSANREKLQSLKLAIDFANAKKHNDSLLWRRQQKLWSEAIGTKVELEQRELAYKNSVNSHKTAIIQYNDTRRQLELNARQSGNVFMIDSTLAEEYTIRSEVRGKVYSIFRMKGELVTPTNPVALIGDAEAFFLELQVDERDIVRIKPGQRVFVNMDSYKGRTFEATVTKVNPVMNERTKSFTVEAGFVVPPELLYPFLTAEANILIQLQTNAMTIPRSYLLDDSLVVTEDKKLKKVVTGLKDYKKVQVLEGLSADEYIIKPED